MRSLKKLCSLLLVAAMLASFLVLPVSAVEYTTVVNDPSRYTDIKGHPYEAALQNALANGVMYGTTTTTASPDATITRAQMATLVVRAFEATKAANIGVFVDMNSDMWCYDYVAQAVQMGILAGNGNSFAPSQKITVQEAACVFARAFNLYGYGTADNLRGYSDSASVSNFAQDAVAACIGAGVITPVGGQINPRKELTRGEFTQMMYRLVQYYASSKVPYSGGDIRGSMMVSVPNVTLNNATISQNLYLGDGVDTGTITLDNMTVNGTVYIRGGSKLVLENKSSVGTVVAYNPSTAVAVETDRTSKIRHTVIDTAIGGVSLTGDVGNVTMNTAKAELLLKDAKVDTLKANVLLPTINIDKDSTVNSMDVGDGATGAKITHEGVVKSAVIDASDVDMKTTKDSTTDKLDIRGDDGKYQLDGKIKDTTIDKNASDNDIKFGKDADINDIDDKSNGKNDLNVDGKVQMKQYEIDEPRTSETINSVVEEITITSKATRTRLTFGKSAEVEDVYVEADDVRFTVESGAVIEDIEVSGEDFKLSGSGEVDRVTLRRGASGAEITTPNTKVINNSGYDAMVGGSVLPSGSTAVTDSEGKWVGTDKEPEDPNDPNKPDPPVTQPKNSVLVMSYPNNAGASDLDPVGGTTLSDLGTIGFNTANNSLQGTVKQVSNFAPMANSGNATGYYVPMLFGSNDFVSGFTVTVGSRTYTSADTCQGANYRNRLIFFLPLNPASADKKVIVTYDADGSGTAYNPTSVAVDYTNVLFEGMNVSTFSSRVNLITGAYGLNGAPASNVTTRAITGNNAATVNLQVNDLPKTANTAGVEGYWCGVTLVGPADAYSAAYSVTPLTAAGQGTPADYTAADLSVSTNGYKVFSHYEDVDALTQAILSVRWLTSSGAQIGATEEYRIDYSAVVKATGSNPDPDPDPDPDPNPGEDTPVVSAINFGSYPDAELAAIGMSTQDFASAYNVQGNEALHAIAGTYYPVVFEKDGKAYDGYYVPMAVTLQGIKADTTLAVTSGGEVTTLATVSADAGEEQTFNVFVPLVSLGSQVQSFTLSVAKSGDFIAVTQDVDTTQAALDTTEVTLTTVNSGMVSGLPVSTYGMSMRVVPDGANYALTGQYLKVSAPLDSNFLGNEGWFAPVRVNNLGGKDSAWTVDVYYGSEADMRHLSYDVAAGTTNTVVLIPLAFINDEKDCGRLVGVTMQVKNGGALTGEFVVSNSGSTLTDAPVTMPDIELSISSVPGHEVINPPADITAVVGASSQEEIDGVRVADVVSGGYSVDVQRQTLTVTAGTLEKTSLSNGSDGWAVPINITISDAPADVWNVTVVTDGVSKPYTVDASTQSFDFWVPVGEVLVDNTVTGDKRYENVTIEVSGLGATSDTYTLVCDEAVVMNGFTPAQEPPVPEAAKASIQAATEGEVTGTPSYAEMISADYQLELAEGELNVYSVGGVFNRVADVGGNSGKWLAPVMLTLDKAVDAGWKVIYTLGAEAPVESVCDVEGATSMVINLPLADATNLADSTKPDTRYDTATVTVEDKDGNVLGTFTLNSTTVTLADFVNDPTTGEGEVEF